MALLAASTLLPRPLAAENRLRFFSGARPVALVELFSSEGCSSCPPAERWLGQLRARSGLWRDFVPVEFHVDYWNYLGWADPLSQNEFTARQQAYAASGASPNGAYTPELMLRGREWRPAGDSSELSPEASGHASREPGVLLVEWQGPSSPRRFAVSYRPAPGSPAGRRWIVHGALLGNGLSSQVTRGENSGRRLEHEFVALRLEQVPLQATPGAPGQVGTTLEFTPGRAGKAKPRSLSAAFWVTEAGSVEPIQATGGDLP